MERKLTGVFLPLGSMLKLKETDNDELCYLVVARAITKNKKDEIVARYRVAPHPYGDIPSQDILSINADQIVEVLHEGYADEEDECFLSNLIERMNQGLQKPDREMEEKKKPLPETAVDETTKLKLDPFYKFR